MFRKRAGDFNVSRTTVTDDILTFRLELPGTIIDWHLKYNESAGGVKTLVGTVRRLLPFSALTLTSIGLSGSFIIITQRRSSQCRSTRKVGVERSLRKSTGSVRYELSAAATS